MRGNKSAFVDSLNVVQNLVYDKSIIIIGFIHVVNLSGFDLNLLRVLDALLQEGSTVRAGQRLGLSQPAISAALGRLRGALGDELFYRRGQGLEATHYALSLELEVRGILDRIEGVLLGPSPFDPATSTARFRLSGSDYFAEMLMPRLAERLSKTAPSIMVHLVDLVPDNYVETLEEYEVDIALIPRVAYPSWVEAQELMRSGFVAVARLGHPRLERAGIRPGQMIPLDLFCDLGHVLFSPEGNVQAMGDSALAKVGRSRRVAMTMPVFSGVSRAIAASDLIGLLPTSYAKHIASVTGLVLYEPPMPVAEVTLEMIWHKRFTNSSAHKWLRGQIGELMSAVETQETA